MVMKRLVQRKDMLTSFSDLYGSSIPRLYNWMTSPLSTSIGLPSVEQVALDCDGKITSQQLQQDKSILNKYWVLNVANEGCSIPAKVRNDDDILYTKVALDWDGKMTSQLQDKSTGCNLNPILECNAYVLDYVDACIVRSAKSITEVYVPILGILFSGWYMLVENLQPAHQG
ncbi:hypothetical protein JHK85_052252 [Glycine max]|nr:hypothetical protein JHK85_052252 [Glycine max]